MAELRCTNVAKSYGAHNVLHDVDLVVPAGTLTAILGASGSGKTTLLRLIIGFIAPDRGAITIDGSVVSAAGGQHVAPDKREVGYVAQEGALFPHLTVARNVAFGLPRGERRTGTRTNEALELVGHLLIEGDRLVEQPGDLAVLAGKVLVEADGEVAAAEAAQGAEELAAIDEIAGSQYVQLFHSFVRLSPARSHAGPPPVARS